MLDRINVGNGIFKNGPLIDESLSQRTGALHHDAHGRPTLRHAEYDHHRWARSLQGTRGNGPGWQPAV